VGNSAFFLSWREGILNRYDGLFGQGTDEGDDEVRGYEDDGTGKRRTASDSQRDIEEEKRKKWAWFSLIYSLCDGDITKVDAVLNRTYIECLTWLSYEKDMKK
jgi:hypothetical protein